MVTLKLLSEKKGNTVNVRVYTACGYDITVYEMDGEKSFSFKGIDRLPQPTISIVSDEPVLTFNGDIFAGDVADFNAQNERAAELARYVKEHQNEL